MVTGTFQSYASRMFVSCIRYHLITSQSQHCIDVTNPICVQCGHDCIPLTTSLLQKNKPSPSLYGIAAAVSSLSTKPVGSNAVLLLWQPIQAVSSYAIMYKVSGSSQYLEGPRVTCNTACNATVTGLTLGFLYIFTLTYSNTQMVTATAIITPGNSFSVLWVGG